MNEKPIFSSDRMFELWRYTVSHHQLLVRSNKDNSSPTRLEILFKDVGFIAISPLMKGLTITRCNMTDEQLPAILPAVPSSKSWYRIDADGLIGYVAAGAVVTNEDDLGYEDESPLIAASKV